MSLFTKQEQDLLLDLIKENLDKDLGYKTIHTPSTIMNFLQRPFTNDERSIMFDLVRNFIAKELHDDIGEGVAAQIFRLDRVTFCILSEAERYVYLDTIIRTYVKFIDDVEHIESGDNVTGIDAIIMSAQVSGQLTMLNMIKVLEGRVHSEHIKLLVDLTD